GGKPRCYVMTPRGPEMREIDRGMSDEKYVEVKGGLHEGEDIILNPRALLSDKDKKSVKEEGGPGAGKGTPNGKGKGKADGAGTRQPPGGKWRSSPVPPAAPRSRASLPRRLRPARGAAGGRVPFPGTSSNMGAVVRIVDVVKNYHLEGGTVRALRGVSLQV